MLAAVAAATPGSLSAEEAAAQAFFHGTTHAQHQVHDGASGPNPSAAIIKANANDNAVGLGYACIEFSSRDGNATGVALAGSERLSYLIYDTSTPYGQADIDELPCQTMEGYENSIRDRMRRFVNDTADFIERYEGEFGLSSPTPQIMRAEPFTRNLPAALNTTAAMYNRLKNYVVGRDGVEAWQANVDQEWVARLLQNARDMGAELQLLRTAQNTVPALLQQMNDGDLKPGDTGGFGQNPLWDPADSVPARFESGPQSAHAQTRQAKAALTTPELTPQPAPARRLGA